MNIKNYFFALYILFLTLTCKRDKNVYMKWYKDPGFWFALLLPFFFLEKIAVGHNLPTVFLCWYNKHQNQVSLTTWNSKKKRWFLCSGEKIGNICCLVKRPWTPQCFLWLILKTGKWLQIVNFFFSYMYHFDKALMSLIETEFFYRGHALYLFLYQLISELIPFCY